MAKKRRLEIAKASGSDTELWVLTLFNEHDETVLVSNTPLDKGEVLNAAKVIRHEGSKANLRIDKAGADFSGWILHHDKLGFFLKLTLISTTDFSFNYLKDKNPEDENEIKVFFEKIQVDMAEAEIEWNPPEEDPATPYSDIETQTKGHPGS